MDTKVKLPSPQPRVVRRQQITGEGYKQFNQSRAGWRNNHNVAHNPNRAKRMINKEIGLVFFLLATQAVSELGTSMRDNAISTELIADAHLFSGERPSVKTEFTFDASSSIPSDKYLSYAAVSDDMLSSTPSTAEESEDCEEGREDEEETLTEEALALLRVNLPRSSRHHAFLHDEDVWDNVLSFLPWRSALAARGVSRFLFRSSLPFVSVSRMPKTRQPALFIPCRADLDGTEAAMEEELACQRSPWYCSQCGLFNNGRSDCANARCGTPRVTNGCRMFLGQLRRSGTVPMVSWLVNYVFDAPRGALLCVENHRNPNTGRGRGCAWPTISDEETVCRMLHSHHRLFYDNVEGVEGVWLVPHTAEAVLQEETMKQSASGPHNKYMPRSTVVVELPAGGGGGGQSLSPVPFAAPRSFGKVWPRAPLPTYTAPSSFSEEFRCVKDLGGGRWRHDPYNYKPLLDFD